MSQFSGFSGWGDFGGWGTGFGARPRSQAMFPPLDEEEAESALAKYARKGLGGLGWIGESLDKLGRTVRGTASGLMGGPWGGGALNLIPFSDTLGITDPRESVSGRDLNQRLGISDQNTPGFDMGDVGGFATEVLTDPLTYMTLGASALTKSGKAAKALGVMPDAVREAGQLTRGPRLGRMTLSLDEAIEQSGKQIAPELAEETAAKFGAQLGTDEPLGGLAKLSLLPFGFGPSAVVGTGPLAQKAAGYLDKAGDWIGATRPATFMKGLFSPAAGDQFDRFGQQIAEKAHVLKPEATAAATDAYLQSLDKINDAYKSFDDAFGAGIRPAEEAQQLLPGMPESQFGLGDVVKAHDRQNYGYIESLGQKSADVFFRNPETGITATKELPIEMLTRVFKGGTTEAANFANEKVRDVFSRIQLLAKETGGDYDRAFSQLLPGRTPAPQMVEQMRGVMDDMGKANDAIFADILAKGGRGEFLKGYEDFGYFPRKPAEKVVQDIGKSRILPRSFYGQQHREDALRYLPRETVNEIVKDASARGEGAAEYILERYGRDLGKGYDSPAEHAQALAEWASTHGRKQDIYTRREIDEFFEYQKAAHKTSRTLDATHEVFRQNAGVNVDGLPLESAFKLAGMNPKALTHFAERFRMSLDEAKALNVPVDVVKGASGILKAHEFPEWAQRIGDMIQSFTQPFKDLVTLPFPSFWARNHNSGQYLNMATGLMETPADLAHYGKKYMQAIDIAKNPGNHADVMREITAWNVMSRGGFMDTSSYMKPGQVIPESPFQFKQTAMEVGQRQEPSLLSGLPGVDRLRRGVGQVTGFGAKVNQQVEWQNRIPLYLYLREKGYAPQVASQLVEARHFDYSRVTGFERTVMKNLVPFYTFSRRVLPLTVENLIEHPGGAMAQTIRGTTEARKEGYVPGHVGEGAAIQMPGAPEGQTRFLSSLGLPFEDESLRALTTALGGSPKRAVELMAGQTNPLLKGPLEWITGKQFFSGRELKDLRPSAAGSALSGFSDEYAGPVSQFIANTPATRFASTLDKVLDIEPLGGRKGVVPTFANLLSGLKVTDADTQKSLEIETRPFLQQVLSASGKARIFPTLTIPKENQASLTPEQTMQMRLYTTLLQNAKIAALEKRAAAGDALAA